MRDVTTIRTAKGSHGSSSRNQTNNVIYAALMGRRAVGIVAGGGHAGAYTTEHNVALNFTFLSFGVATTIPFWHPWPFVARARVEPYGKFMTTAKEKTLI